MFTAGLFIVANNEKQSKSPHTGKWVTKLWYIHTLEFRVPLNNEVSLLLLTLTQLDH